MRIDIPVTGQWRSLNEAYRAQLPSQLQDPALQVQIYRGYQHALYEAAHGLARLFSHKKTIALLEGAEPALESIASTFSEDGYHVKRVSPGDLADFAKWLEPIQTDLLFVLYAVDDPVTGMLSRLDAMNDVLKDKRVFRLALVHSPSSFAGVFTDRPAPFKVRVLSLAEDRALILAGERFRIHPMLAERLPWAMLESSIITCDVKPRDLSQSKAAILDFESRLPAGFKAYFSPTESSRLFDRAVIFHEGLDGSAVIEMLGEILSLPITSLEATSPCRWNQPRFTDWLLARGEKPEVIRGLLMIDASQISPKLLQALEESARRIESLQTGN